MGLSASEHGDATLGLHLGSAWTVLNGTDVRISAYYALDKLHDGFCASRPMRMEPNQDSSLAEREEHA